MRVTIRSLYSAAILFVFAFALTLATGEQTNSDCRKCHTCKNPTVEDPCLPVCPFTDSKTSAEHSLSEAPDTIMLNFIEQQFEPVRFDHKKHASMSQMNLSCKTCHHFSPPDRIPPCHECHGSEGNPVNINQPSLKGAYHRQCMGCHREWSHDTKCVFCHSPADDTKITFDKTDKSDIMGTSHPVINVPTIKIYHTTFDEGPIVTFYHDEHINLFGFQCVDCHVQENCGYCHDLTDPDKLAKTEEEKHAICSKCHDLDNCSHCHDRRSKPAFTHDITGWPLNRFHKDLGCRTCHPPNAKITKLNKNCNSCHFAWNQQNFRHYVTGLMLDETHSGWECSDCHTTDNYSKPDCSGCHDADINPTTALPGKKVAAQ